MEDCFKRAILRYGRPLSVYVDQGSVYKADQFNTVCASLGIQHIPGTPYYPEGRGKIERFFQFVQSDFLPELAHSSVATLRQLNESLLAWIEVVYHLQCHSETGQAPLERFRQDSAPTTRPADPEELRQAFLHRDRRQVTKTATFSFYDEMDSASLLTLVLLGQSDLAHKLRFTPFEALDQRIAIRFHLTPFDLEETAACVKHHLRVAGRQEPIFSDGFLASVHDHTKGVARKINNLCRTALLLGATEHKPILDETDLKRVIRDLEGQVP